MKTINCVVRLENGQPIIFWYEVHSREYSNGVARRAILACFNYAEGHNEACHEYMRSLKPCASDTAERFVSRYNYNYCDDGQPNMRLCKRLVRPKL